MLQHFAFLHAYVLWAVLAFFASATVGLVVVVWTFSLSKSYVLHAQSLTQDD